MTPIPHLYSMHAIPCREISPKQKQDAVIAALERLSNKKLKNIEEPKYASDAFWLSETRSSGFGFPISWKLMGSMFEGVVSRNEDRTPDLHHSCDDRLGCASTIPLPNTDARVTPQWFSQIFVPEMAIALDAYRFELIPKSLIDKDRQMSSGRMKMYRWDVIGTSSISFYDDRICVSAFGISAAEVCEKLSHVVPYAATVKLRNRMGVVIQSVVEFTDEDSVTLMRKAIEAVLRTQK